MQPTLWRAGVSSCFMRRILLFRGSSVNIGLVDEATDQPPPPADAARQRAAAEAHALFEQANERQRAGDLQEAVALYGRAIARFPAFPDALNNLAITLKAQRQLPAAIACLQRAL